MRWIIVLTALVVAFVARGVLGQDVEPEAPLVREVSRPEGPAVPPRSPTADSAVPAVKPVAGKPAPEAPTDDLVIDRQGQRLTIAGTMTGTTGLIELGATSNARRTFLAAVKVSVPPSRIVEAMKALGVEPGQVPVADVASQTATEPKGRRVRLILHWDTEVDGGTMPRQAPLEHLFWNRSRGEPLPESSWVYAGGSAVGGDDPGGTLFVGDLSGSVATINRMDTSALFYYGGPAASGMSWYANTNLAVKGGMACRLEVLVLPPVAEPADRNEPSSRDGAAEKPPIPVPASEAAATASREDAAAEAAGNNSDEATPSPGGDGKPSVPEAVPEAEPSPPKRGPAAETGTSDAVRTQPATQGE